jgi:hypothetical protein
MGDEKHESQVKKNLILGSGGKVVKKDYCLPN